MSTLLRLSLLLGSALFVAACSIEPSRFAGPLQRLGPIALARPAVAGVDGPMGMTQTDTGADVWVGAAPVVVRTADVMASQAARGPAVSARRDRPRARKIRPDRRQLFQNPAALALTQDQAPSFVERSGAPLAAQSAAAPEVDVATFADTGSLPPDTMGDVGPTQYLAGLNGRLRTLTKTTGAPDGALDLDSDVFFAAILPAGAYTSDPRVRYDRRTGRWLVLMISVSLPNRFLLAVSSASTITGSMGWTLFQWDNTRRQGGVSGAASCLADYPTLGVDEDALYIGVNQFCGPDVNALGFDSASVFVVNKAALVGGTLSVAQFDGVLPSNTSDGVYTPQGVDNFDSGTNQGYVIGVDNRQFGKLVLHRIASPGATPSISSGIGITVPATGFPIDVPHPGGVLPLDGLDDRLLQAVVRHGRLWTTHQIEVNASGAADAAGERNGVRWYEIGSLAATPTVVQSGTVFDHLASDPVSYWMGAIMPNGQGHAALGMSAGGEAARVNAVFTGRLASDPAAYPPGVMDPPTPFSANAAFAYNRQRAPETAQRWGDYSYTSVDPDDDMTFWTIQQYVNATDSYAVRLVRLLSPPPATVTAVAPAVVDPGVSAVIVRVTGSAAGGRGFFDPGPGFARRLSATLSGGGVTVTSAVVTSPTSLTLVLNTTGAAPGARTLTITNPDGQTTSLTGALTIGTSTPGPPPQQFAVSVLRNRLTFTWQAPPSAGAEPVSGYLLEAGYAPGQTIAVLPAGNTSSFTIFNAPDGVFFARLRAQTAAGVSAPSNEVQFATGQAGPPLAPLALLATVQGTAVSMQWTENPEGPIVAGYQVRAGSGQGLADFGFAPLPPTTRTFAAVAPPGTYYVRVVAVNAAGAGVASNEAVLVAQPGTCTIPATPTGFVASAQPGRLTVRWGAPASGAIPTTYVIHAGSSSGASDRFAVGLPGDLTSASGLVPPGPYFLRVFAANACGASGPSAETSATIP